LAGFGIFWSLFIVILSFTQISNSCTIIADPTTTKSICDLGIKQICTPASASDAAPFAISAQGAADSGSLFCGWPIGLTANRLFAGFLNMTFSIMHVISMINGRFLLAKTSSYAVVIMCVGFPIYFL
jgi:hypothetical protein